MNADFHYYATYLAARLAKYEPDEAQQIAYASAFTDFFDANHMDTFDNGRFTFTAQGIPSSIEYTKEHKLSDDTLKLQEELATIGTCFHFLPDVDTEGKGCITENMTPLLCKTNSALVREMISDTIDLNRRKAEEERPSLQLIGLRMHVLADTWAHQNFAGLNEAVHDDTEVTEIIEDELGKIEIHYSSLDNGILDSEDSFQQCKFIVPSKTATYYNHIFELGHMKLGNIPDYSSLSYSYKPSWSDDYLYRNGPQDFIKALQQMAYALRCIKNGMEFELYTYQDLELSQENQKKMTDLLKVRKTDNTDEWIEILKLFGEEVKTPFDSSVWYDAYKENPYDCTLLDFDEAALYHKAFVFQYLDEQKAFIQYQPKRRIQQGVKKLAKINACISEMRYSSTDVFLYRYFYPITDNEKDAV